MSDLINQTVGDALSDMLMVEAILANRNMTVEHWQANFYQPLPNRLLKVKVKDRSQFRTTDADRKLVEPVGLQAQIEQLYRSVAGGRAFVRPSGTEDVVRIYSEANTRQECEQLAYRVARLVFDQAGGVGDAPEPPKQ
jgi:phosphoacetylglucosamine mutase